MSIIPPSSETTSLPHQLVEIFPPEDWKPFLVRGRSIKKTEKVQFSGGLPPSQPLVFVFF